MLQLLIPAVMAWGGWMLFTPPGVAWVLSQTPFAVALAGYLLGDHDLVGWLAGHLTRRATPPRQPVFLPPGVASLSDHRRTRDTGRRAA